MDDIVETTRTGHQKILRILLSSMLAPDFEISTHAGAVPLIFRKGKVLRALPLIARRFPSDVSWFLEELSHIPIPICVPKTVDLEPAVRSKLINGIRIGYSSLKEVSKLDVSTLAGRVWGKLNVVGPLREASRSRTDTEFEKESVICMAPESLFIDESIRVDGLFGSFNRETNSLIRLLATGNSEIILMPITQALMEYHWVKGRFWLRFATQFSMVIGSIVSCSCLFWFIVQREYLGFTSMYLPAVCAITICFCILFLLQECRQFYDEPRDYFSSSTNVLDLSIHSLVGFIAIFGGFGGASIPVLLMSLLLVLHATRLLLHLRILPSIGPLVRITVLASVNILPILIPMGLMLLAFSGGFLLLQQALVPGTKWKTFSLAFQFVATMITFDYTYQNINISVLDDPALLPNFVLRLIFHTYFLVALV